MLWVREDWGILVFTVQSCPGLFMGENRRCLIAVSWSWEMRAACGHFQCVVRAVGLAQGLWQWIYCCLLGTPGLCWAAGIILRGILWNVRLHNTDSGPQPGRVGAAVLSKADLLVWGTSAQWSPGKVKADLQLQDGCRLMKLVWNPSGPHAGLNTWTFLCCLHCRVLYCPKIALEGIVLQKKALWSVFSSKPWKSIHAHLHLGFISSINDRSWQ